MTPGVVSAQPTPRRAALRRLGDLALGLDPRQRGRVALTLLAAGCYALSVVAELLLLALGIGDAVGQPWLIAYIVVGPVVFLALVRSGWSKRLRDPSMNMAQMLFAISANAIAYPLNGQVRGLNLLLVSMVPIFGFLAISWQQARLLAIVALGLFGVAMVGLPLFDPLRFDPRIEFMHLVIGVVSISAMALPLGQISAMRSRLRVQQSELEQALRKIEAVTIHDDLTGLVNRRHMGRLLDDARERRSRQAAPFCVGLIDLDHFKRVNDTRGHAGGDLVLRRFAAVASTNLRDADVLARWGGEEFLLLLPETTEAAAAEALDRLRRALADPAHWHDCAAFPITFSAGLAEDRGDDLVDILGRADGALYRAKAAGRDRVALA